MSNYEKILSTIDKHNLPFLRVRKASQKPGRIAMIAGTISLHKLFCQFDPDVNTQAKAAAQLTAVDERQHNTQAIARNPGSLLGYAYTGDVALSTVEEV